MYIHIYIHVNAHILSHFPPIFRYLLLVLSLQHCSPPPPPLSCQVWALLTATLISPIVFQRLASRGEGGGEGEVGGGGQHADLAALSARAKQNVHELRAKKSARELTARNTHTHSHSQPHAHPHPHTPPHPHQRQSFISPLPLSHAPAPYTHTHPHTLSKLPSPPTFGAPTQLIPPQLVPHPTPLSPLPQHDRDRVISNAPMVYRGINL